MKMDNLDEIITAVSITFSYQNYLVQQSGVLLYDYVLTTGGILLPYVYSNKVKDIENFDVKIEGQKGGRTISLQGVISNVVHSNDLNNALIKNQLGLDSTTIKSFSNFIVIRVVDGLAENSLEMTELKGIRLLMDRNALYKGQDILTVSTPFGNNLFLNCYSKGIISNLVDTGLFITDSRLSPGSEGGPIYMFDGYIKLIGLVLTPIMKADEYTGFNLCCSYFLPHEAFAQEKGWNLPPSIYPSNPNKDKPPIHRVSDNVLPIKTSSSRGSCILLHENGLLVTCSHVVNYDKNTSVEVTFHGKPYEAKVLCCSSKDDILDLAFLKIHSNTQLPSCAFSDIYPNKGEAVYMIGYEKILDNFLQLVSKGTILKHVDHGPIYTSCLTHSGNSGGGLFEEDGKLLAIVCGILFETDKRTLHHFHNVSIPINIMKEQIDTYVLTGDISPLKIICGTRDLHLPSWGLFIKSKL